MRKSEIWTEIKNTDSSRMAATRRALANCQKPTTTAKGHSTKGCDGANISNNNSDDSLLQGKYLNMLSIAAPLLLLFLRVTGKNQIRFLITTRTQKQQHTLIMQ